MTSPADHKGSDLRDLAELLLLTVLPVVGVGAAWLLVKLTGGEW